MTVLEHRVTAMQNFAHAVRKKGMKRFLGTIGYYYHFVENFADKSAVLTPSMIKSPLDLLSWTSDMVSAFNELCVSMYKRVVLHVSCVSDKILLYTDVSVRGVGGFLCVSRNDKQLPAGFFNWQCRDPSELEALVVVLNIMHFVHFCGVIGLWLWQITAHSRV